MLRILLFIYTAFSVVAAANVAASTDKKNALPEIGVVASDAISIDKEILIGDALMRQLRSQAPLLADPVLEEYLTDLGNRLMVHADNVKFPYTFFWINNPEINAFAFFGGHIGVHTGLIANANTESELASVIAHEISHVTQRHIARRIAAQKRASSLQIASMIGSLLLALADPEAGIAAISATQAGAAQGQINYTRSNEKEADRVGYHMLAKAGFDPAGAADFFGKLLEQSRLRTTPPAFLLTHPLPASRVSDARARLTTEPRYRVPPSLRFHLAKARIHARYLNNARYNVSIFEEMIKKKQYVFKQAAEYGLAIAYLDNEEVEKADDIITRLLQQDPENLFYIDVATDIDLAKKQFDRAIQRLETAERTLPRNAVVTLNFANAAIKKGDYNRATELLNDFLLVNPEHSLSYQLLADAYGESKQFLQMHQTKAELYALLAAYPRAIDELHTAYNFAIEDHLEKQRIRARIEQFREAQERLKNL